MRAAAALLALVLTAGCVSPSRSDHDYVLKAGNSAKGVASAVATALLGVELASRHRATSNYLSVVLGNAEEDASSVQTQFDGVQPPSVKADAVRAKLDDLLSQSADRLAALRITARRGQLDRLAAVATPLRALQAQLQQLAQEWK